MNQENTTSSSDDLNDEPLGDDAASDQDEAPPQAGDKPFNVICLPIQNTHYDFAEIFGNELAVELEIGIGKGRFIMQSAAERPDTNFIGIEWAAKYYRLAAGRALKKGMPNIRFLRDDAAHTVREALADKCLNVLHIYFPDPWPKKKQKKRRLVQTPFLDQACRIVKDGGLIKMATDHVDYFEQMVRVTRAHPLLEEVECLIGEEAREGVTNFEVKYRKEGRTIHNLTCKVLAAPAY